MNTTLAYDAADRLTTLTHWSYKYVSGGSGGGYVSTGLATYGYGYDCRRSSASSRGAISRRRAAITTRAPS